MDRPASRQISVHLLDLPRMLEEVITRVLADAGLQSSVGPPPPQGRSSGVTVLVMSPADPAACIDQLLRRPDVSLLLIEARASEFELLELWPIRRRRAVVDAVSIADAVNAATSLTERSLPYRVIAG